MKIVDPLYFYLMHRDDPICAVTIDPVTGTMVKVGKPESPELLPPGGCTDGCIHDPQEAEPDALCELQAVKTGRGLPDLLHL